MYRVLPLFQTNYLSRGYVRTAPELLKKVINHLHSCTFTLHNLSLSPSLTVVDDPLGGRVAEDVEPSVAVVGIDGLNRVADGGAVEGAAGVVEVIGVVKVEAVGFTAGDVL